MPRSLPAQWKVTELAGCFVVEDSAGPRLACIYFKDERTLSADHTAPRSRRGAPRSA